NCYTMLVTEEDYDAFCLAYMFTYRDFEMGTLGLAWTGDLKNAGGVCEKKRIEQARRDSELEILNSNADIISCGAIYNNHGVEVSGLPGANTHYRGSMKSLNTGIVTLLNYGKHVPPAVSHVTLAHEIGHNFGSPHDPEQCSPGGEDGNFIMFARATSGDKKNNNRFSPCSLKSINPVLNFKARSPKGCFTEPKAAICGNGVVEEGEQCDCGWEEDCRDQCCWPMRRYAPPDEPPCRLTPRSSCSPSQRKRVKVVFKIVELVVAVVETLEHIYSKVIVIKQKWHMCMPGPTICCKQKKRFWILLRMILQRVLEKLHVRNVIGKLFILNTHFTQQGPCCTSDCQVKFGDKCRDDNGCRDESFCNGGDPQCPPSINKPNKTICNKEFVCFMGECTGSICLAYGLESCQCIPSSSDPKTKACELCCKLPGDSQPCISSFEWNDMPYDIPDMYSKPGTPCNNYIGYCDVFQMCREVLSTKYLGKKPNIKLKAITIMHKSTKEAVRLPPDGDGGVTVHPGVRSKLPLKRKVRDGKVRRKRKGKVESINNNLNSPNKTKLSPKKKKRVSAPVGAEETRKKPAEATVIEIPHSKVKKQSQPIAAKKKKKKKEIIDYSSIQADIDGKKGLINAEVLHNPVTPEADPVGKVQNWLLKSQYALPKSKSTPVGLTDKAARSTHKRATIRPRTDKSKSHSVGNIPNEKEKVRLQVVYKPPFKFSVKLRKPEKTSVVIERVPEPVRKAEKKPPRTGVLVRTVKEKDSQPQQSSKPCTGDTVDAAAVSPRVDLNPDIDSNIHTVQSDLEVLLSESEFLFSDD
ncbi:hypothetical protein NQ317_016410, partial [Molorchus minor]